MLRWASSRHPMHISHRVLFFAPVAENYFFSDLRCAACRKFVQTINPFVRGAHRVVIGEAGITP